VRSPALVASLRNGFERVFTVPAAHLKFGAGIARQARPKRQNAPESGFSNDDTRL
jgi:hypothetical protein